MERRTEIPAYDCAVFAREVDRASLDKLDRPTVVPASHVGRSTVAASIDLEAVPMWTWTSEAMPALDPRAAFLLLNVDGVSSFETVIDLSHVPREEAIVQLVAMLDAGLIAIVGEPAKNASPSTPPIGESGVWTRGPGGERWAFIVEAEPASKAG